MARIGRVRIDKELLKECPDLFSKYLSDVTVLNTEAAVFFFNRDNLNTIDFLCECGEFDDIEDDITSYVPYYTFYFTRQPDGTVTRRPVVKESDMFKTLPDGEIDIPGLAELLQLHSERSSKEAQP